LRAAIVETSPLGGLLHYSVQLGDALAARGHDVDLLTTRGNEMEAHDGPARMRPVLTPPVPMTRSAPPGGLRALPWRAGILARLSLTWARIAWETRPGRYDAVLLGDVALPPITCAALGLTALPGRPVLAEVCHNVRDASDSRIGRPLLGRLFRRVDLVLVHGDRSRAEFDSTWAPAHAEVFPHGDERIFASDPPPPAGEERILFFGNWRDVKGLGVLMDAFDDLAARRPGVSLTIAGRPFPDSRPDEIRRWAARHGERVQLVEGYIAMEDVRPLFADARVVVAPYLAGSQSGVVHLAMTMARPVVATDVGDIGDTVRDGDIGRVVEPGDATALAAALDEVVSQPDLAERLGAAARRKMDQGASWEDAAEALEAHLERAIAARQAPRSAA
jgi:glycosyltransferase involved in cell wall biosynthesis